MRIGEENWRWRVDEGKEVDEWRGKTFERKKKSGGWKDMKWKYSEVEEREEMREKVVCGAWVKEGGRGRRRKV